MQTIVRVRGSSVPAATAGSIANLLRAQGRVQVQAMGAAAVNQAMKAITVARKFMQSEGSDLSIKPHFETVVEGGAELTLTALEVTKE